MGQDGGGDVLKGAEGDEGGFAEEKEEGGEGKGKGKAGAKKQQVIKRNRFLNYFWGNTFFNRERVARVARIPPRLRIYSR